MGTPSSQSMMFAIFLPFLVCASIFRRTRSQLENAGIWGRVPRLGSAVPSFRHLEALRQGLSRAVQRIREPLLVRILRRPRK